MAKYLASVKPFNPSNTKLVWPVEGMSKLKKAEWCEISRAYEVKNGVLYYHHSDKDHATGVVKSKYEIGLILILQLTEFPLFASSKSVSNSLLHQMLKLSNKCINCLCSLQSEYPVEVITDQSLQLEIMQSIHSRVWETKQVQSTGGHLRQNKTCERVTKELLLA